jgi:hypothetical protein
MPIGGVQIGHEGQDGIGVLREVPAGPWRHRDFCWYHDTGWPNVCPDAM